jgi:hypothetical protein
MLLRLENRSAFVFRKKQEIEQLENALKSERERLEAAEVQAAVSSNQRADVRRQKILSKLEQVQRRQVKENLRVSFDFIV